MINSVTLIGSGIFVDDAADHEWVSPQSDAASSSTPLAQKPEFLSEKKKKLLSETLTDSCAGRGPTILPPTVGLSELLIVNDGKISVPEYVKDTKFC